MNGKIYRMPVLKRIFKTMLFSSGVFCWTLTQAQSPNDLSGRWHFRIDPQNEDPAQS